MKTRPMMLALAVAAAIAAPAAMAEGSTADGIAQYRAMLAEGNPAELWELAGEDIWKEKAGPKQASLEQCDLGKGPGVVKGASAALPRYFKDTDRVQDLESRLMTCMQTLQGISPDNFVKGKWGKGEMEKMEQIVAYVVGQSRDMKINVDMSSPQMKKMYALGKKAFFYRAGPMDFACSTCHGEDGKRIRLQDLPNLSKNPGDGIGFAAWPAYRVSNGQMWSMQHRLNDCYRQQRFPEPGYASDATVALGVYLGVNAKGSKSIVPAIKR